jgi:hypothetical protein
MARLYRPLLALTLLLYLPACDTGDDDGTGEITRVVITEVEVENAPLVQPDGDDWDGGVLGVGEEPDIYFDLVNADTGSPILGTTVEEFSDVQQEDLPIVWSPTPGADENTMEEIEFTRFGTPLAFDLWDADPELTKGDDDFMGSTESFTIQELVDMTTPPTVFTVQCPDTSDVDISIRIRLRYER